MTLTNCLLFCAALVMSALISCEPFVPDFPNDAIEAYEPIYASDEDFQITKEGGRSIGRAGKIYSYGSVLLINEVNKGIHVIDNADPTNPQNLYFIAIPGNTDMAMEDGLVYANNLSDLAVIRITTEDFEVINRLEGVMLEEQNQRYPLGNDVYFECADPDKGRLLGWRLTIIERPDCYKR